MTNFQKIVEFHTSFGLPSCNEVNKQNLQDYKIVSLRVKLIQEEYDELSVASTTVDQLDAIGDLLYVVYGAGTSFGFNLDKEFHEYCVRLIKDNGCDVDDDDTTDHHINMIAHMTNFEKTCYLSDDACAFTDESEPKYVLNECDFNDKIREFAWELLMGHTDNVKQLLIDMLFSLYSVGYHCKFDLDKLFTEIHRSNMSKLCGSEQEAIDTVEWYRHNQSDRYPKPSYAKLDATNKWVVFDETTDKRLKSIHYSPPNIVPSDLVLHSKE